MTEPGLRTADVKPLSSFPFRRIDWFLQNVLQQRMPVGSLSLVVGAAGTGKSTWVMALAAMMTQFGDEVLFIGAEDSPGQVLLPRLMAAGGDPDKAHIMLVRAGAAPDMPLLPTDVELLRYQVKASSSHPARRLIVIDTLAGHIDGSIDTNNDPSLRRALIPFAQMLEETGTTAIAIMHQNKNAKAGTLLNSINGGTAYGGVARSVLVFGHLRGDEMSDDRIIVHAKANYSRKEPALVTTMHDRVIQFEDDQVRMAYCGVGDPVPLKSKEDIA